MALCMLHYYFLKQTIEKIPAHIKDNLEYDNSLLFNLATFNDLGIFYKLFNPLKKDKYKLNDKLDSEKFDEFILECIQICKTKNDYAQLLFIYAMISHTVLIKHINPFLSTRLTKKIRYDTACNMIDYYYTKANDSIDLCKTALTDYFPTGFIYHDFMDRLIHKPFIKVYGFMCSNEYFTHAMSRKYFYYAYCNRSKTKMKLIAYKLYDLLFNHRGKPKASCYLYSSKVNTSLFNLGKKPYLIGDNTYTYTLDEVIQNAASEAKEYIDAVNAYISYDNDKYLKKILHIEKKEKL